MKTNFSCSKCMQSSNFYLKEVKNGTGVAVGQYCSNCHAWIKWVGKQGLSAAIAEAASYYSVDKDKCDTTKNRILSELVRCKDIAKKLGEDLAKIETLLRIQTDEEDTADSKAPWEE